MKLSLVIPVYNEEASLPELFTAIMDALQPRYDPWEVVFVDDGSTDGSLQILRGLAAGLLLLSLRLLHQSISP